MENTIKIGEVEIKATCYHDICVFVNLDLYKNGVKVATIGEYDIDTKIKPENRAMVKAFAQNAIDSYVLTDAEIARMEKDAQNEKMHNEYKAHYNRVLNAMNP